METRFDLIAPVNVFSFAFLVANLVASQVSQVACIAAVFAAPPRPNADESGRRRGALWGKVYIEKA